MTGPEYQKVEIDTTSSDLYYAAVREEYERWARESLAPQEWPEYQKTNRETALTPKLGYFWCQFCDKSVMGQLGKCGFCGKKNPKVKIK